MANSETYNEIFKNNGIEIEIDDNTFLKIKETLTRIGIASNKNKKIYQTCHILHKRGKYGILHFKELFILDNKYSDVSVEDLNRRTYIVKLLSDWGLVKIKNFDTASVPTEISKQIKVLPYSQKKDWTLVPKYTIGK